MYVRIALIALLMMPALSSAQEQSLLLKGEKDQVITALKKAIDDEFGDAKPITVPGRQGYVVNYRAFLTGPSSFAAFITPMAFEDEWSVSAFAVDFDTRSSLGSNKGRIQDVIERLKKSELGPVQIITNRNSYRALGPQSIRCAEKMVTDPKLNLIESKIPLLKPELATLIQLSDDSKPSLEESKQVAAWSAMRDVCFNLVRTNMTYYPADPRMAMMIQSKESADERILALYKGTLTYGQFNSQRKQSSSSSAQNQINKSAEIDKQNAQNAALLADKQAAFELERQRVMAEQMKAQALQTQANKPTPRPVSPGISCTTTNTPGGSVTNCD